LRLAVPIITGRSVGNQPSGDKVASQTQPGKATRTAAHDMFDRDTASRSLGLELLEAGDGQATVRMRVTDAMVNGHAMTHGGYVFMLADTAFACACNSHGPVTVAAGADIEFLRPTAAGDLLTAFATERVTSGRSGIYDVTVTSDGEVIAEFRGRSRAIGPGRPA
jgi:acyl-CoA thioesterase